VLILKLFWNVLLLFTLTFWGMFLVQFVVGWLMGGRNG